MQQKCASPCMPSRQLLVGREGGKGEKMSNSTETNEGVNWSFD